MSRGPHRRWTCPRARVGLKTHFLSLDAGDFPQPKNISCIIILGDARQLPGTNSAMPRFGKSTPALGRCRLVLVPFLGEAGLVSRHSRTLLGVKWGQDV